MSSKTDRGYVLVSAPDHPLARKDGRILEHRKVLYDEIGPGWHLCHWCRWPVSWEITHRADGTDEERFQALVVDHLNGKRDWNALENLAASCPFCNANRDAAVKLGMHVSDFADIEPRLRPLLGQELARKRKGRQYVAPVRGARPRAERERVVMTSREAWRMLLSGTPATSVIFGLAYGWLATLPEPRFFVVVALLFVLCGLAPAAPERDETFSMLDQAEPPKRTRRKPELRQGSVSRQTGWGEVIEMVVEEDKEPKRTIRIGGGS